MSELSQLNAPWFGSRAIVMNMDAPSRIVRDALALAEHVSRGTVATGDRADFSRESLKRVDRFFDEQVSNGKPKARGLLSEELGARLLPSALTPARSFAGTMEVNGQETTMNPMPRSISPFCLKTGASLACPGGHQAIQKWREKTVFGDSALSRRDQGEMASGKFKPPDGGRCRD
jgi:hypothetical protein